MSATTSKANTSIEEVQFDAEKANAFLDELKNNLNTVEADYHQIEIKSKLIDKTSKKIGEIQAAIAMLEVKSKSEYQESAKSATTKSSNNANSGKSSSSSASSSSSSTGDDLNKKIEELQFFLKVRDGLVRGKIEKLTKLEQLLGAILTRIKNFQKLDNHWNAAKLIDVRESVKYYQTLLKSVK